MDLSQMPNMKRARLLCYPWRHCITCILNILLGLRNADPLILWIDELGAHGEKRGWYTYFWITFIPIIYFPLAAGSKRETLVVLFFFEEGLHMWGGVVVWNPQSCIKYLGSRDLPRNTISPQDLQKLFEGLMGQLRQLLGLKSDNLYGGESGTSVLLGSERGFTEWENLEALESFDLRLAKLSPRRSLCLF